MSRKDYVQLASDLRAAVTRAKAHDRFNADYLLGLMDAVEASLDALRNDNPNFNSSRFIQAAFGDRQ